MFTTIYAIIFIVLYLISSMVSKGSKKHDLGVVSGIAIALIASNLAQDIVGKEAYIAYISGNWAPAWLCIPLMIVIAILVFVAIFIEYQNNKENKNDKEV
jgi:hypothetical protein